MHPTLEVTVTGEHRGHGKITIGNGLLNGIRQRAGVTDTGGATITHQVETKLVEVVLETTHLQVIGHHLGARSQGGFHPGFGIQPPCDRFLGNQARSHHHAGVGRIGAGGDCCDDHRAGVQPCLFTVHFQRLTGGVFVAVLDTNGGLPAFRFQFAFAGL